MRWFLIKSRKGSILLAVVVGGALAFTTTQMLLVATDMYVGIKDSAKIYANEESYRTAAEIACYQFVMELQKPEVKKDLAEDWIKMSTRALYTQALDSITAETCTEENNTVWNVHSVYDAVNSADLSNSSVLDSFNQNLVSSRQSLVVQCPEPFKFDSTSSENSQSSKGCHIKLEPFLVNVTLTAKAEEVVEQFYVDGVYLDMRVDKLDVGATKKHKVATFTLGQSDEEGSGVKITRA